MGLGMLRRRPVTCSDPSPDRRVVHHLALAINLPRGGYLYEHCYMYAMHGWMG